MNTLNDQQAPECGAIMLTHVRLQNENQPGEASITLQMPGGQYAKMQHKIDHD